MTHKTERGAVEAADASGQDDLDCGRAEAYEEEQSSHFLFVSYYLVLNSGRHSLNVSESAAFHV